MTFAGNFTQIVPDFINLPVNTNILHVCDPPNVQQDRRPQEFIRGKIHCQNFINQDLTFLQLSVVHVTQSENNTLQEGVATEVPSLISLRSNSYQKLNSNHSQISAAEVLYDRNRSNNRTAPIQPIKPVLGLTQEEWSKQDEDPDLTLEDLLGLTSCEDHIMIPL